MSRSLIHFILFVLIILGTVASYPLWLKNITRIQAYQQLISCIPLNIDLEKVDLAIYVWAGNTEYSMICPQIENKQSHNDIVIIARWLQGKQVSSVQVAGVSPVWKQQLFEWRNRNWHRPFPHIAGIKTTDQSLFIAQLAIQSRRNFTNTNAFDLAHIALDGEPDEQVVQTLILGFGVPRNQEEVLLFDTLHQRIAHILPDYTLNYVQWFNNLLRFKAFEQAKRACDKMREHISLEYEVDAALCEGKIALFKNDFATAYKLFYPLAKRWSKNEKVLTALGYSAKGLQHFAEATSFFEQAIQYEQRVDNLFSLYRLLGESQKALGETNQARKSFEKALDYAANQEQRYQIIHRLEQLP